MQLCQDGSMRIFRRVERHLVLISVRSSDAKRYPCTRRTASLTIRPTHTQPATKPRSGVATTSPPLPPPLKQQSTRLFRQQMIVFDQDCVLLLLALPSIRIQVMQVETAERNNVPDMWCGCIARNSVIKSYGEFYHFGTLCGSVLVKSVFSYLRRLVLAVEIIKQRRRKKNEKKATEKGRRQRIEKEVTWIISCLKSESTIHFFGGEIFGMRDRCSSYCCVFVLPSSVPGIDFSSARV